MWSRRELEAMALSAKALTPLEEADRLHGLQDKVDLETRQALSRRMGWVVEAEAPTLEHKLAKEPIVDEPPVGDGPVDDPPMGEPPGEDEPLEDSRVDSPPVVAGPVDDPPMGEPTVEDEPMEDPRVGDPPEETHPVHDSPEEDPPGEDEPLEVLPMENNGQDHPVKGDAAFEGVAAFPHHLKGSRHRRKLFCAKCTCTSHQASQSPPSRRMAGMGCFGTTEGRR